MPNLTREARAQRDALERERREAEAAAQAEARRFDAWWRRRLERQALEHAAYLDAVLRDVGGEGA